MAYFSRVRTVLGLTLLAVLAACQTPAPPPPPPPPPVVYAPYAPTPPFNASANTYIPLLRADGLRDTINRDLGPLETLWHVRAAMNVAALSCTGPLYERIVGDYNSFISKNSSYLRNANNAIIRKFQRDVGAGYKGEHDRHQTALYNHWSFSPLRRPFCDQAVQISQRSTLVDAAGLDAFAAQALMELEQPFNDFYLAYEQYERDLDEWRRQYAPEQLRDAADENSNATGLTGGLAPDAQPAVETLDPSDGTP